MTKAQILLIDYTAVFLLLSDVFWVSLALTVLRVWGGHVPEAFSHVLQCCVLVLPQQLPLVARVPGDESFSVSMLCLAEHYNKTQIPLETSSCFVICN